MKLKDRKQNRMNGFDYSSSNHYFITICIKGFKPAFSDIVSGKVLLNDFGRIVERQWLWLSKQYNYVKLDNFVVMPEHFHGIIEIIDKPNVGTTLELSLPNINTTKLSLPRLIGAFKTTSSKKIHLAGLKDFQWQRSYYDTIIKSEEQLNNIREYIQNNPANYKLKNDY